MVRATSSQRAAGMVPVPGTVSLERAGTPVPGAAAVATGGSAGLTLATGLGPHPLRGSVPIQVQRCSAGGPSHGQAPHIPQGESLFGGTGQGGHRPPAPWDLRFRWEPHQRQAGGATGSGSGRGWCNRGIRGWWGGAAGYAGQTGWSPQGPDAGGMGGVAEQTQVDLASIPLSAKVEVPRPLTGEPGKGPSLQSHAADLGKQMTRWEAHRYNMRAFFLLLPPTLEGTRSCSTSRKGRAS